MNKFLKLSRKIYLGFFFLQMIMLGLMVFSLQAQAADVTYTPQVPIPGKAGAGEIDFSKSVNLSSYNSTKPLIEYIRWVYKYAIGIVGILATLELMYGGFIWLSSAGKSGSITDAKNIITSSIVGLVLALSSYLILATISPDLVNIKAADIKVIEPLGCCPATNSCTMTDATNCKSGFDSTLSCVDDKCQKITAEQQKIVSECTSKYGAGSFTSTTGGCNYKGEFNALYSPGNADIQCCVDTCAKDSAGSSCQVMGESMEDSKPGYCDPTTKTCNLTDGKINEWCGGDADGKCLPSGSGGEALYLGRDCESALFCTKL